MPTVSGVVKDAAGNPVQRFVRLHDRASGAVIGRAVSDPSTGAYSATVPTTNKVYAIAFDATSYDPYWDKVVLAMHMDDTGLTDVIGHTVTVNGAVRSATQSKFGGYSAYFGGSNNRLSIPMSSDFDFGSNDFTVELQYYPVSANPSDRVIQTRDGDFYSGFYLAHNSATQLQVYCSNNGASFIGSGIAINITQNQWQHIAVSRVGNVVKAYLDGTDVGTSYAVTGSLYYSASDTLIIGGQTSGRGSVCYIDEVLVTNGIARRESNFTAPSSAFANGVVGGSENAAILDLLVPA